MDKRFIVILVAVIALIGGIFFFTREKANSPSEGSSSSTTTNHSKGNLSSSVEVIEYGDFQCSVCAQFYPIVEQVFDKYQDKIKFTFVHFPIDTIHPNARAAHRAAEAAGKQGKFFEMYDLLYQNIDNWSNLSDPTNVLEDYATQIGLNLETFKTDFASAETNSAINADINSGKEKGVTGTPTFFIAGVKVENTDVGSVDLMSAKIEEALNKASQNTTP